MRRWITALAALLAVVAVACQSGDPAPGPSASPGTPGPVPTGLPGSIVAIGDSITVAFGSCLLPAPCPQNSWSTGGSTDIQSHYLRLARLNPAIVGHATNLGRSGTRMADLLGQATSAVAASPAYVTILMGGNDACRASVADMTGEEAFRSQLDAALTALKAGLPKTKIFVATIPDLYRLWDIGHTNTTVVNAWNRGVCPSLLARPTSDAAEDRSRRTAVRERVDAYNRALSSACHAYGRNCDDDGGAVRKYKFTVAELSPVDFFHPNAKGQQALAAVTWAAGPYAS